MNRYRGVTDQSCVCGTEYNLAGQRLTSDWRSNPSTYDDDISDLDGQETALIRAEGVLS